MASSLDDDLLYKPDPRKPEKHGTIQPSKVMNLDEYQGLLASTRDLWEELLENA